MTPLRTRQLPRQQIGEFIDSPRGVRAFEDVQADTTDLHGAIATAGFLTLNTDPELGSERVLTPATGELVGADGGAGAAYTLGLADTVVVAGSYGGADKAVSLTVDAKGRLTAASEFPLDSDNVAEGSAHLFFTDARARAAISGGSGIAYAAETGVVALEPSGVTAGTYTSPSSITVDASGRITAIA